MDVKFVFASEDKPRMVLSLRVGVGSHGAVSLFILFAASSMHLPCVFALFQHLRRPGRPALARLRWPPGSTFRDPLRRNRAGVPPCALWPNPDRKSVVSG